MHFPSLSDSHPCPSRHPFHPRLSHFFLLGHSRLLVQLAPWGFSRTFFPKRMLTLLPGNMSHRQQTPNRRLARNPTPRSANDVAGEAVSSWNWVDKSRLSFVGWQLSLSSSPGWLFYASLSGLISLFPYAFVPKRKGLHRRPGKPGTGEGRGLSAGHRMGVLHMFVG